MNTGRKNEKDRKRTENKKKRRESIMLAFA
jgi:hypothetical protein